MAALFKDSFKGKICVVTGAGRGLGRAVSRMFIESGARVVYISRTPHVDLLSEIEGFQGQAMHITTDVSRDSEVKSAVEQIEHHFGLVDILVNNAAIMKSGSVDKITPESWDDVMAINVRGYFLCMQAVLPHMKRKRYGKIVNVSSIAGRDKSLTSGCPYTASKAAIIGLTRHVSNEVASFGINVNCICPGPHRTPLLESVLTTEMEMALLKKIPLGYIAQPEQIAGVILFLASDLANYMTGAVVDVNGGLM